MFSPIRKFDFDVDTANIAFEDGYRGKVIYNGESCILISTFVPAGAKGPGNHTHTSDQIYYVLDGDITIQLGEEVKDVTAGSVIFVPAGVPHHNWNPGDKDEIHLEILAPGGIIGRPLGDKTTSTDAQGLPYYTECRDLSPFDGENRRMEKLITRAKGSRQVEAYVVTEPAGDAGPPLHIHDYDQFYLVLDGSLHVQYALTTHVAHARELVVIPAGVPHRQWNEGPDFERHLVIHAPGPEQPHSPEHPWFTVVDLAAKE
ncbi:cupin domain-containing protein [Amycolatopsis pithecellobii]|uniref:Cupin domain-containing protein n=1 Tax=Amycolatopsis pithecellobii TaxID=664692 RepID=A0A6N7YXK0_9PSEU|nr:cupin domain-containing protein [Amycolatopsis pithecellobii]MTD53059.1 cupin domain-containing protein [Amycolatopsis pithecellobii]